MIYIDDVHENSLCQSGRPAWHLRPRHFVGGDVHLRLVYMKEIVYPSYELNGEGRITVHAHRR